jgi:ornithine decarboxylase
MGISAERILYSNPVKVPSHIAGAYKLGVRVFSFDSLVEIEKLAMYAPGSSVQLRLKVSDYGSKFPLSSKFGLDAHLAADYCSMAEDAGLQVKGITFHVGSQSENPQVWEKAIKTASEVISEIEAKGMNIEWLNLGGGFPADYGDPVPGLQQASQVINSALKTYIPERIKIMAEPGRYMVTTAGKVVASVIGRENRSGTEWIYLDIGTFQGLIEPLEMPNLRYPIKSDKSPRGSKKAFMISGPTCDAYDTLGDNYLLPSDLNVGDRLTIGSAGAYSLVYASNFNGFEPPKVYYATRKDD